MRARIELGRRSFQSLGGRRRRWRRGWGPTWTEGRPVSSCRPTKRIAPDPHSSSITTASLSSQHGALHLYLCIVVYPIPQAVDTQAAFQHPASSIQHPDRGLATCCPLDAQPIFASHPRPEHARIPTPSNLGTAGAGPWPSVPSDDPALPTSFVSLHALPAARAHSIVGLGLCFHQSTAGLDQHPTTPQNHSAALAPRAHLPRLFNQNPYQHRSPGPPSEQLQTCLLAMPRPRPLSRLLARVCQCHPRAPPLQSLPPSSIP